MPDLSRLDSALIKSSREAASLFASNSLPLRLLQKSLSSPQRYLLRTDPHILKSVFSLASPDISRTNDEYYFWDSTTLSLFEKAQEHLDHLINTQTHLSVLDLGCGPYAILGCALKKLYPSIYVTSTDLQPQRVESALYFSRFNNLQLDIHESDLLHRCPATYDLILFNPPYVVPGSLQHTAAELSTEETISGIAQEPTLQLLQRLIDQFLLLPGNPTLLLGVNNFFLSDDAIISVLSSSDIEFSRCFNLSDVTPSGCISQVYSLLNRN